MSKLAFRSWGKRGLPPVFLLHGFLGSSLDWKSLSEKFSGCCRCIAPDLPGHGKSLFADSDLHSVDSTVEMLADLIRQEGYSSVALMGYSLGGRIALSMAVKYPELVETLILESSSPGLKTDAERVSRKEADLKWLLLLERGDIEQFLSNWYAQPLFSSLVSHLDFLSLKASRICNNPSGLRMSLRESGTGAMVSLWQSLSDIKIPVHLLVGEKDSQFRAIAREMMELLPFGSLHVIGGAGHNIHVESPQNWLELMKEICKK